MRKAINWVTLASAGALVIGCSASPPTPMKTLPAMSSEAWAPQDVATNVQDWDRAAAKIADGLEYNGMLGSRYSQSHPSSSNPGNTFLLRIQGGSMFLRQLKGAVETEITRRGGTTSDSPNGAIIIDLRVDVVQWGSRLHSEPGVLRRAGVWQAAVLSGNKTALSFRQPFSIYDSDLPLYQQTSSLDQALARTARPLHYGIQ
jgi:hypothetical protein